MSRDVVGASCAFLIAMGLGRSYGQRSRVLGRGLPGILECDLWTALRQDDSPVHALVTDIGNDVIYGVPVATIVDWVAQCVDRLRAAGAGKVVVTLPPIASIETLSPWRYHVAKSLLFPGRRMSLPEALARCRELAAGIGTLGARDGVTLVEPDGRWYGLDPIHPRRRHLFEWWRRVLGPWTDDSGPRPAAWSPGRWARLRTLTPAEWSLLGREMGRPQPSGHLRDGSTLSLY